MGFADVVKSFYKRFFDFRGRSPRSEYWWAQLFMWAVVIVLAGVSVSLAGGIEAFEAAMEGYEDMPAGMAAAFFLIGLFVLSCVIPALALTVRRFHDHDRSGWWYVLVFVLSMIPLLGLLMSLAFFVFYACAVQSGRTDLGWIRWGHRQGRLLTKGPV